MSRVRCRRGSLDAVLLQLPGHRQPRGANRLTKLTNLLTTALIATLILGGTISSRQESTRLAHLQVVRVTTSNAGNGPCDEEQWNGGPAKMRRAIRCVWQRFDPGEGGAPKAIAVASCESGLNPRAQGPNGSSGLFQHIASAWPGRFDRFINDHDQRSTWGLSASIWSGRTQAIVTSLMVRRSSWSSWSCA